MAANVHMGRGNKLRGLLSQHGTVNNNGFGVLKMADSFQMFAS